MLVRKVEELAYKTFTIATWFAENKAGRLKTTAWNGDVDDILRDVDDAWYEEELDRHAH